MTERLERVKGGFNAVRFYEEYASSTERRKATKGVALRQPTGKARGFILVDHRREMAYDGRGNPTYVGSLTERDPGDSPGTLWDGS